MSRPQAILFSILFVLISCGGTDDLKTDAGDDAGSIDNGAPSDTVNPDSGPLADLAPSDEGEADTKPGDEGTDLATPDEGPSDEGAPDSSPQDEGVQDEGPQDEGAPDLGVDEGSIEEDTGEGTLDEGQPVDPGEPEEPGLPAGTPCVEDFVCDSDFCAPSNEGQICGQPCEDNDVCAEGWSCVFLEDYDRSYCLEFDLHLCRPCNSHDDCNVLSGDQGGHCVTDGVYEGSFCATTCGEGGSCPDGYSCESVENGEETYDVCRPDSGECGCGIWAIIESASTQCGEENCYAERTCTVTGLTDCPALTPEDEICDGIDNNCNGSTDDGLTPPLADLQLGICAEAVQVCDGANGWIEPTYGADYETTETICDALDNDCDGEADNGLTPPLAGNQEGVCNGEIQVCTGAEGWVEPDYTLNSEYEETEGFCDGLDNDCDGAVDDDLVPPLGSLFEGVCSTVTQTCEGTEGWQDPEYANLITTYQETESLCDGLDNDCDAQTDEELVAPEANNQNGICAGQVQVCGADAGWLEPDYAAITNYEATESTCDGLDNDCDGAIDNDLTPPLNDSQFGLCVDSLKTCDGEAGWVNDFSAVTGYEATEATCDGLDNDCDDSVDEDLGTISCGAGVCTNSVPACTDGVVPECTPLEASSTEICDGLDNDCDGTTDDEIGLDTGTCSQCGSSGSSVSVSAGSDPHGDCGGSNTCNGGGSCCMSMGVWTGSWSMTYNETCMGYNFTNLSFSMNCGGVSGNAYSGSVSCAYTISGEQNGTCTVTVTRAGCNSFNWSYTNCTLPGPSYSGSASLNMSNTNSGSGSFSDSDGACGSVSVNQ
jgi:hypothetical protein